MILACQDDAAARRVPSPKWVLSWENMVMGQNFVTAEHDQLFLLPPDAREWLPGRHLAWAVLEAAGELEMAPFTTWYRADGQGRPAYHPRLMVGLVMYCYCKGIRSSRAIEMATFDDVGARVICGNLHPDHATVARFVSHHETAVKGLLVQSLVACAAQGLVSVDVVTRDGTKVKASASMAANATAAQLEVEIGELETLLAAEVEAWFAQAQAAAARLEKIARLERRVARHQAAAAREEAVAAARVAGYQARAAAKAAAGSRKRPDGRVPVPPDRHVVVRRKRAAAAKAQQALAQAKAAPPAARPGKPPKASPADPASGVMPAKKGGFDQLHNVQALAGRHQVIYAIGTHGNPTDRGALHPLLQAGRANLDAAGLRDPIGKALFDAGYASEDNFTTACEPELYVAITKEARQTGRLRDGHKPATMKESWQHMAARLDAPEGKALYRQRAGIIEPVFAQLFARLGRDLHYRDTKADLELHLWAASHNLLKAIRARARRAAATPAATPVPAC